MGLTPRTKPNRCLPVCQYKNHANSRSPRHLGGPGAFSGWHNFSLNQPRFEDHSKQENHYHYHLQSGQLGTPLVIIFGLGLIYFFLAVRQLSEWNLSDAELHSRARFPQPECLAGTRVTLIKDAKAWLEGNSSSNLDAWWLYGPMGVGKSAIAQTLGKWAEENNLLGAAVFLSEGHNEPYRLFLSIAYQLAKSELRGPYTRRVVNQLVDDPTLLHKDLATQFNSLILRPLSGLTSKNKLVIIIDGLDECQREDEESEILRLISTSVNSPHPLPVRWLICSRPESHLRREVLSLFETRCKWKEVSLDSKESHQDIEFFIREGFKRIAKKTAIHESEVWPTDDNVIKIVRNASGLFIYASTIVKYVDTRTPRKHLTIVMEFIADAPVDPGTNRANPLKPLDTLYSQILNRVEKEALPTTLQLLGTCILLPQLPVLQLANLMNLNQESFYEALDRLHSVANIPPPNKAATEYLRLFHTSFREFLRDPSRSSSYAIYPQIVRSKFVEACFQALGKTKLLFGKELGWKPLLNVSNPLSIAHHILCYAATYVWRACVEIGDAGNLPLLDVITNFNFAQLRFVERHIPAARLREFVYWFSKQVSSRFFHLVSLVDNKSRPQIQNNNRRDVVKWNEVDPRLFVRL